MTVRARWAVYCDGVTVGDHTIHGAGCHGWAGDETDPPGAEAAARGEGWEITAAGAVSGECLGLRAAASTTTHKEREDDPVTETLALVDEHDAVIGTIARSDVEPDDIIRVSLLWIEDEYGDVLLQQRALTKFNDPGRWGATAGTVEYGETYESNVEKEATEELGLGIVAVTTVSTQLQRTAVASRMYRIFRASISHRPAEAFRLQVSEVARVQWWTKADLMAAWASHPERFAPSTGLLVDLFCGETTEETRA